MKVGMRTPSPKKMIKARTTGRANRVVKGAVNPLYGKKGMGLVNNPKRAVYNKFYRKLTFSPMGLAMMPFYIMWNFCVLSVWFTWMCFVIMYKAIIWPVKLWKGVEYQQEDEYE